MSRAALDDAISLLEEAAARVRENGTELSATEVAHTLAASGKLSQLVSQMQVGLADAGQRSGVFARFGYKKRADSAVADVLGVERGVAQEIVRVAGYTSPQIDEHGEAGPAVLPAMAAAFHSGQASLRHVDKIGRLL